MIDPLRPAAEVLELLDAEDYSTFCAEHSCSRDPEEIAAMCAIIESDRSALVEAIAEWVGTNPVFDGEMEQDFMGALARAIRARFMPQTNETPASAKPAGE